MKKLLTLFKKNKAKLKISNFSDFFLHASPQQQEKVILEAAKRANEEQREVFKKLTLKAEPN